MTISGPARLLPDLRHVKAGCVTVFALRATHPWPPNVEVHEHRRSEYASLTRKYNLKHVGLEGNLPQGLDQRAH